MRYQRPRSYILIPAFGRSQRQENLSVWSQVHLQNKFKEGKGGRKKERRRENSLSCPGSFIVCISLGPRAFSFNHQDFHCQPQTAWVYEGDLVQVWIYISPWVVSQPFCFSSKSLLSFYPAHVLQCLSSSGIWNVRQFIFEAVRDEMCQFFQTTGFLPY